MRESISKETYSHWELDPLSLSMDPRMLFFCLTVFTRHLLFETINGHLKIVVGNIVKLCSCFEESNQV